VSMALIIARVWSCVKIVSAFSGSVEGIPLHLRSRTACARAIFARYLPLPNARRNSPRLRDAGHTFAKVFGMVICPVHRFSYFQV